MKINRYILLTFLAFGFARSYAQQTVQFSQYIFNGLAVNPAYAGYKEDWTLSLSSRLQWTGIEGAPKTSTVSADGLTRNSNIGLGFIATSDLLGPQNTSSLYANYAYRLRLDENDTKRISFGIAAGLVQYSLDGSKFTATDIGDGNVPSGSESKLTPDFRLGIYYYTPDYYVGASVLNVLSGTTSFTDNPAVIRETRHVYLTAGALLPLTDNLDLKPSVMFKEDFKSPTNLDLNAFILLNKIIWLGASYRTGVTIWNKSNLQNGLDKSDAIAAIFELKVNDVFRFGYSYDFTTSQLAGYQSGTHEISVSITFKSKKPRILSPRYF
ncbi:type IX secretion system membrane protein PorP/SprF [Mucilaginibacter sp. AW1-3]